MTNFEFRMEEVRTEIMPNDEARMTKESPKASGPKVTAGWICLPSIQVNPGKSKLIQPDRGDDFQISDLRLSNWGGARWMAGVARVGNPFRFWSAASQGRLALRRRRWG